MPSRAVKTSRVSPLLMGASGTESPPCDVYNGRTEGRHMVMSGVALPVDAANERTIQFCRSVGATRIAEIGIYEGHTSRALARYLGGRGTLHLFDYADRVDPVVGALSDEGYGNVVGHGNSAKTFDSYTWSLMQLLEANERPIFDYAYLDGSHL